MILSGTEHSYPQKHQGPFRASISHVDLILQLNKYMFHKSLWSDLTTRYSHAG